jgi:hypothetical protein
MRASPFRIGVMIGLMLNLSFVTFCKETAHARPAPPCTLEAPLGPDEDAPPSPVCMDTWKQCNNAVWQHLFGTPFSIASSSLSIFGTIDEAHSAIGTNNSGQVFYFVALQWTPLDPESESLVGTSTPEELAALRGLGGTSGYVVADLYNQAGAALPVTGIILSYEDPPGNLVNHFEPLEPVESSVADALRKAMCLLHEVDCTDPYLRASSPCCQVTNCSCDCSVYGKPPLDEAALQRYCAFEAAQLQAFAAYMESVRFWRAACLGAGMALAIVGGAACVWGTGGLGLFFCLQASNWGGVATAGLCIGTQNLSAAAQYQQVQTNLELKCQLECN